MGVLTEALALLEPDSPHRNTVALALVTLGSSLLFLIFQASKKTDVDLPFAGVKSTDFVSLFFGSFKFVLKGRAMLDEGYYKYPNKPFQIPTYSFNRVILPAKYLDELRNAPDAKMNFVQAGYEFLHGKVVGLDLLGVENPPHTKVCKTQLTTNLAKLIDPMLDETKFAFKAEFPEGEDWTPVTINAVVLRLVARISGRVFVGPEHCRNEEWIKTSIKFTEDMFANAILMTLIPKFIRVPAAYILPFRRRVQRHRAVARKYLSPIYAQRMADKEVIDAGEKPKVDDIYTWMIGAARPQLKTADTLAEFQLILAMAAIHTTTLTVVAVLYDLAARPEYIGPLREEMEQAIMEDGGVLKKSTLGKMMKLDSFMKESQRINSSLLSFSRKALQSVTLSDGFHIPQGTRVAASVVSMNNDPKLIENPETFDGYRYYKLRQQEEEFKKHQFVSTSPTELNFGYGTHACPGRFFAANEIQVMLISLLLRYDMKYPEGEGRPANWKLAENTMQDITKKLLFKKRENALNFSFL